MMLSRFPKCFSLFDLNSLYLALRSAFSNHTSRFFCGAIRNSKKSNVYSKYSKYRGFLLKVLLSEPRWAQRAFNFKKISRRIFISRNADGTYCFIYFVLSCYFNYKIKFLLVTSAVKDNLPRWCTKHKEQLNCCLENNKKVLFAACFRKVK